MLNTAIIMLALPVLAGLALYYAAQFMIACSIGFF